MLTQYRGLFTALITPFKNDKIDRGAIELIVTKLLNNKVAGFVPCGTTGESPTLDDDEWQEVCEIVINQVNGKVPVMVGAGSNSTAATIKKVKQAAKMNANSVLLITPYYNKPTNEGLFEHFKAISESSDLPIFLYNNPGRTITDLDDDLICRLSELKNIVGVKDATGDLERPVKLKRLVGENFIQFSGNDSTALVFNVQGGFGCISALSNVLSEYCVRLQTEPLESAIKLNLELSEVFTLLYSRTNPIVIKYAASLLGLCTPEIRLPLSKPDADTCNQVKRVLTKMGLYE